MRTLTRPVCIVDGHHGIYVPQVWAERYGDYLETCRVSQEDVVILLQGPDHSDYWEAWQDVLNDYCHEVNNVKHYLSQDGDLFEYPETYEWEEF